MLHAGIIVLLIVTIFQVRAVADGNPDNYENCNKLLRKWVEKAPTCSSGFHKKIGSVLSDIGYKYESEVNLANGVATVDIALLKHKIVVEADGPTHYTVNSVDGRPWMMGSTKLRNEVIRCLGWQVIFACSSRNTNVLLAVSICADAQVQSSMI